MGMIERLYEGRGIQKNANPEKVQQILALLQERLGKEMGKVYYWGAVCTVAVEAGRWGGERRRKRRLKLLKLINECMVALGEEVIVLAKGWEMHNLHYGYNAIGSYSKDTNINTNTAMVLGLANSHGPRVAVQMWDLLDSMKDKKNA